jgi:hypothetical protein
MPTLPNPGMSFTPFDPLPAADLNNIVENIEAIADLSVFANGDIPINLLANYSAGKSNYVESGCVITGTAYGSTLAWSMTSGVVWINGRRYTVSAASGTVTASRDTYFDVLEPVSGSVATLVNTGGNIVTNNAASPTLAANSIRIGTVVSGASSIAASTSIGQGGFANTVPVISSQILKGFDSLGNLVYPKGPVNTRFSQIPYKFSAYRSSTQAITANTVTKVVFDTKRFDTGNNYDTATATFTVPIAGYYYINGLIQTLNGTSTTDLNVSLYKNGSQFRKGGNLKSGTYPQCQVSGFFQLAAGDTLDVRFVNIAAADSIEGTITSNSFEGYLISAS